MYNSNYNDNSSELLKKIVQ